MSNKLSGKLLIVLLLGLFSLLTSCENLPFIEEDGEEDEDQEVVSEFSRVETSETNVHLSPASGINCTLYVAPDGDDNNNGSDDQPWGSFQYAAESIQAGDTVCFRDGIYEIPEGIYLTRSGTPESPITFAAYPGEQPVLDGMNEAGDLITIEAGISYIRLSGFVVRNFRIWGIFLTGENRYIAMDHLEVDGGETSIRFTYAESSEDPPLEGSVEYITLEDSIIHDSEYSAVDCTPGPCHHMLVRGVEIYNTELSGEAHYGADGLEFARGQHVLVEDCYVHNRGGDGIDLGSRDRDGNMVGIVVRNNRVERNFLNGIKVWAGGRIENNLIWGNGNSAIWSGTWNSTIEILNNTVAYNMWDPYPLSERNWAVVIGYPEEIPKPNVRLTMAHNIFAFNADLQDGGPTGVYLGPGVQLTENNNLYYSSIDEEITAEFISGHDAGFTREEIADGTWTSFTGQGQGNLTEDPLFVSGWPQVNLQLKPGSPAENFGAHF